MLKERRPGLIVIDSFKALRVFAEDDAEFRRFLYQLAGRLTAFPAACLWVGEYGTDDIALLPEFAVADAIVDLATERRGASARCASCTSGNCGVAASDPAGMRYRVSRAGVRVFPRLADSPAERSYAVPGQRVSTGLAGLDQMLDGGYWPGAATLVAGPTGSGKTLMGLHFVFGGARQGEPGVIATLQENPSQLELMLRGFGWAADDPAVEVMYRSPVDIYVDEWVADLMQIVERAGARRVLVDSLLNLQIAAPDETRFREFTYSLTQRFAQQGVSMLMTHEVPELFGARSLSDFAMSHLSDNVITLHYYWEDGSVNRAISVLKSRASRHESSPRQYEVASHGIVIGDRAHIGDRPGRSWAS